MTARVHGLPTRALSAAEDRAARLNGLPVGAARSPEQQPQRVNGVQASVLRPNIRTQPQKIHGIQVSVLRKRRVVESLIYGTPILRLIPASAGRPQRWVNIYPI